jgi:hypothetical protein
MNFMIVINVRHVSATRERRDYYERGAHPVAEEIEWLDISGVPIAAALVEDDEYGSLSLELRLGVEPIKNVLHHRLEKVELGGGRMTVEQAVRLAWSALIRRQARLPANQPLQKTPRLAASCVVSKVFSVNRESCTCLISSLVESFVARTDPASGAGKAQRQF